MQNKNSNQSFKLSNGLNNKIIIVYANVFLKTAKQLSIKHQEKLADLLEILTKNPFHPYLHTKSLKGELIGFYSFRITRDWRVIFQFINLNKIKLIRVGNRKDIYKKNC